MIAHLKPLVIDLKARQGNKGQDMNTNIIEIELSLEDYKKVMNLDEFDIERKMLQTSACQYIRISLQPERLNPEDHFRIATKMVCDSPIPENKENQGVTQK